MRRYEYIVLPIDLGDLSTLNNLGSVGFLVVAAIPEKGMFVASLLLMRDITDLRCAEVPNDRD